MKRKDILASPFVQKHALLLKESYEKVCGKPFPVDLSNRPLAEALYDSTYVLVSHGMEKDPVFNYANRAAQELWGMEWTQFTQMPSRLSAREDKVEKREAALREAFAKGYITGYEGIRINAAGKEFYIKNVTLWNLIDSRGMQQGQAAIFDRWEFL